MEKPDYYNELWCEWCGNREATEKHHLIKRSLRPDLVKDKDTTVKLCSECHRRTENDEDFYKKIQNAFLNDDQKTNLNYE